MAYNSSLMRAFFIQKTVSEYNWDTVNHNINKDTEYRPLTIEI